MHWKVEVHHEKLYTIEAYVDACKDIMRVSRPWNSSKDQAS